jgi:ammonia channel protein AmtB
LRPSAKEEEQGLDIADHGEEGYVYGGEVTGTGFGHGH